MISSKTISDFDSEKESDFLFADDRDYFLYACSHYDLSEISKASIALRSDKEFMLSVLECANDYDKGDLYAFATEALRHDREFAMACFSHHPIESILWNIYPAEYRNDRELAFTLMSNMYCINDAGYEPFLSEELCKDAELAKEVYYGRRKHEDDPSPKPLPKAMRDNEEVLKLYFESAYVDPFGAPLRYASDRLRDDEDFVEYIVCKNERTFCACSKRLKSDRNFILRLLKQGVKLNFYSLPYWEFKDDEEIARYILPYQPSFYEKLSERLRAKREFADIAVKNMGPNEEFMRSAPEEFRNDLDYALIRIEKGAKDDYFYLSEELKARKDIAELAFEKELGQIYNKEVAELILEKTHNPFIIGRDLFIDRELALKAVDICPTIYFEFPEETRNDAQITFRAFHNTFPYIHEHEIRYEVQEYDYRYDIEKYLIDSLHKIGPKLQNDYEFTEKLVDAFLRTKQAKGFTKENLMENFSGFYQFVDDLVWADYNKGITIEYDKLNLAEYIS